MSELSSTPVASAPPCVAAPTEHATWFKEKVHVHAPQLKSYLHRSFPAVRAEVEDIAQESFLRIWKRQLKSPIASGKSFLFQIARRLAIDTLRRKRVVPMESLQESDVSSVIEDRPDAAETLSYDEKAELLAEALARLSEPCRTVVILRKLRGLPQKEVATQLGLTEGAVESHVIRGLTRLENDLRAHGIDGFCYDERP